jgi:hypothetical protein
MNRDRKRRNAVELKKGFWVFAGLLIVAVFTLSACGQSSVKETNTASNNAYVEAPESSETPVHENASSRASSEKPNVSFKLFPIYTDASSPDNHYVPSGWMGDYGDLKFDDKYTANAHGGGTSIQVVYSPKASQGARWAGIYWQNPPNNWGTRPGGYDLTGAKKLTFWARGDKGGERIEEFKIGGITGEYADSDVAGIGPVVLTAEWQEFTIDLEGKDLSSISGGFAWATNLDVNPEGCTFYLDDIRYE